MGLSTRLVKSSINNGELAGLVAQFYPFHAYVVFASRCFGVTPRIALVRVLRDEAAELAIDVEVSVFRGIVEKTNVRFRCVLCRPRGIEDQPNNNQRRESHAKFHSGGVTSRWKAAALNRIRFCIHTLR